MRRFTTKAGQLRIAGREDGRRNILVHTCTRYQTTWDSPIHDRAQDWDKNPRILPPSLPIGHIVLGPLGPWSIAMVHRSLVDPAGQIRRRVDGPVTLLPSHTKSPFPRSFSPNAVCSPASLSFIASCRVSSSLHSSICMLLSSSILGLNPLRLETPWTRGALVPVRTQMRSACRRCRRSWLIRSSALALSLSLSLFSLLSSHSQFATSQLQVKASLHRLRFFDSLDLFGRVLCFFTVYSLQQPLHLHSLSEHILTAEQTRCSTPLHKSRSLSCPWWLVRVQWLGAVLRPVVYSRRSSFYSRIQTFRLIRPSRTSAVQAHAWPLLALWTF